MVVHRRIILAALVLPVLAAGARAGELRDETTVDIAPVLESSRTAGLDVQPPPGRQSAVRPPRDWSLGPLAEPTPQAAKDEGLRLSFGTGEDGTPVLLRPDAADAIGGMIQFHKSLP